MTALFAYVQSVLATRDEEGVTALEYGLLAALIAVALVLGATALGGGLNTLFDAISKKLPTTV